MNNFKKFLYENSEYVKIGGQRGSNTGGVYTHTPSNKKYYVKFYNDEDQARSEALSDRIHEHLGGNTLKHEFTKINGKPALRSEWVPNMEHVTPETKLNDTQKKDIATLFHGSTLTNNWDFAGLEHDNLGIHPETKRVHILDTGASFKFRAQGGRKPYGPDIDVHDTLRNPQYNPQTSDIMDRFVSAKHLQSAHKPLTPEDHEHIKKLFMESGISNKEELHKNFVERTNKLHARYS